MPADQTVQQRFYVDALDAATPHVVFDRVIVKAGGIGDVAGPFVTKSEADANADRLNRRAAIDRDIVALKRIHVLLDGNNWSGADTLVAIADILRSAGFEIGPPGKPAGNRQAEPALSAEEPGR